MYAEEYFLNAKQEKLVAKKPFCVVVSLEFFLYSYMILSISF